MSRMHTFAVGDAVQTPLGKGVVREPRKNGRLAVEIHGRSVIVEESAARPLESPTESARRNRPSRPRPQASGVPARERVRLTAEMDLHGLTVEEALALAESAINDALLGDLPQLRLIHGRSGGRIRAALHRRLREIPSVRGFRLHPGNAGVTNVTF